MRRDSDLIAYRLPSRMPKALEKLDWYGIDLMLLPRGWMTQKIRNQGIWLTLFENINAGLYLRRAPHTQADLAGCGNTPDRA